MGFATEINDPLAPLRENPVSEEIIRPLSELLITDLLVGPGRARRIVALGSVYQSAVVAILLCPGNHRAAIRTSP